MATITHITFASLSHRGPDPPSAAPPRRPAGSLRRRSTHHKLTRTSIPAPITTPANCPTLSSQMLHYAERGLFPQAQSLWGQLINSSLLPTADLVSRLVRAYAAVRRFDEISRILREIDSRNFSYSPDIYSLAVSCFGRAGELGMMEHTMNEMRRKGFKIDSATWNGTFLKYSAVFGSIAEMERAYERLKKSGTLIEKEAIRTMASAYIRAGKFYQLGEFMRGMGLGRRNVGSLLWNLLLLSYAANFKMKSLQREFLRMADAGFSPDVTTFNVRALAFSRMCMFWDLHLSVEHMKHVGVVPDLVTYGCVVDAYVSRRLGRNLSFALDKMDPESSPVVSTDPIVFEVFGKGDFHSTAEALLESTRQQEWTYAKLIAIYLKKVYRSNQVFWNY